MRARLWLAFGALALGVLILAPALAPLSGSMDALAGDLANGSFRPFGTLGQSVGKSPSGALGGFTGSSGGNYVPGAADVPSSWLMDRDGTGGSVVIDSVFNPDLGAMKRLKTFDHVEADGATLDVVDKRLRPLTVQSADPAVRYDFTIVGSFQVQTHAGEPVPIFSVHPKALITDFAVDPPLRDRPSFLKDGADTFYILASESKLVTLNLTYLTSRDYYSADTLQPARTSQYAASVRPQVPANLLQDAQAVLARAGVKDAGDVPGTIDALSAYFRSFTEGDIPPPSEVQSLYQALALGGHGCCRHRAFAFMVTAQSVGIPTRVVVNEAHAFVEVMTPDGRWHQINLGGCGAYTLNNPNKYEPLVDAAQNPRGEANPDEGRPAPITPTTTEIVDAPSRIVKGETYFVNGTVQAGGRPVPNTRVDVYLNVTKTSPGRLTGSGTTASDGRFSVSARVPADADAQGYQLVARSAETIVGAVRFGQSWSDPSVDVYAPTSIVLPAATAAARFPARVSGQLVDVDGHAVAQALVAWSLDGAPGGTALTDARGIFAATLVINETGTHTFEARYEGDAHHGVAAGTTTVLVSPGAILLPSDPPTLTRGKASLVEGDVRLGNASLSGVPVTVQLQSRNDSRAQTRAGATTDDTGHFAVEVVVPLGDPPGIYTLSATDPRGLNATGVARVVAGTTLTLDAPSRVSPGDTWVATAHLLADNGTPLAGAIVELSIDGNGTRALLTNRTGYARFELPAGAAALGGRTLRASFPGDGSDAAVAQSASLDVVPPLYARVPWWAYAAAGLAILLVPLVAWLLRPGGPIRRSRAGPRWSRRVALEFPELPPGSAPTVEPGASLAVRARILDKEGKDARGHVILSWPGGRARLRAGETVRVPAADAGPLPLHARHWRARPADIAARAQSWREAVEWRFVSLRERAGLPPSATPGDLARALPRASNAARLFELADYSEAPVDAAFYSRFCEEVAAAG